MPRARRTQSGEPAQATGTGLAGVRYGEGTDLRELQETAPSPNSRAGVPRGSSIPTPARAPVSADDSPLPSLPTPGLLLAPSTRPAEAVTAGLSRGPGAGPEALMRNPVESPTGRFLRELSRITGRTAFADMARRSNL